VNRALLANPRDVGARQVGALLLAEHGHRQQALALLRQAIADGDFGQRRWLYQTAARLVREPAELLASLPGDPSGLPSAAVVGELLDELGSMQPIPWPLLRAVAGAAEAPGASASLKATAAIWSARAVLAQRDAEAAVGAAARLGVGADPLLWAGLLDLVIDAGDDQMRAAATELATAALAGGERAETRRALGRLCLRRGQLDEARLHLDRALALATDGQTAALVHDVRAEIEERAGNPHRAEHERALATQRRRGP
jgi:tetratricopeptide (TPR) repeat protein